MQPDIALGYGVSRMSDTVGISPSVQRQSAAGRRTTWSGDVAWFWAEVDERVVWAPDPAPLRRMTGATLDHSRLAISLCPNAPAFLRRKSFWPGVNMVPPGEQAREVGGKVVLERYWNVSEERCDSFDLAATELRSVMRAAIELATSGKRVSCDVSGGVDSTAIAYFVAADGAPIRYYHAGTQDPWNRDTHYARRAAIELGGEWVEAESFTTSSGAFEETMAGATDELAEGPPGWGANSRHLANLLRDAADHGIEVHLNGLGGDELFTPLPAVAVSLLADGHTRLGLRALLKLFRSQRWPLRRLPRTLLVEESYGDELRRRARRTAPVADGPDDAFSWAPGFGTSRFLTTSGREMVVAAVDNAASQGVQPTFEDRARHQVAEAVQFQGEVVRQVNAAFASIGVTWVAPMLDDAVTALLMSLSPAILRRRPGNKPLLAGAASGVVPSWVFERADKGEYSADLFGEYQDRRRGLAEFLVRDSFLVDHGLVDPRQVHDALNAPVIGTDQLFEIEQLVLVERWAKEYG